MRSNCLLAVLSMFSISCQDDCSFPPAEVSPQLSSLVVPICTSQFGKDVFLTFKSAYIIPLLTISSNFPWIKLRLLSLTRLSWLCLLAALLYLYRLAFPRWDLCGSLDTSFSLLLTFPALPGMSFLVLHLTKFYSAFKIHPSFIFSWQPSLTTSSLP